MISRRTFFASAAATAAFTAIPAEAFTLDSIYAPQMVRIRDDIEPGRILILPQAHFLYLVTGPGQARRYGVGLGKAGQEIYGDYTVGARKEWPTWRPTDAMIERDPAFARFKGNDYVQPGGPENPLGARALYLFKDGKNTFNAIHGTTAPQSIGHSVSNGCVRMINDHVIDLYERVPVGTKVTVL